MPPPKHQYVARPKERRSPLATTTTLQSMASPSAKPAVTFTKAPISTGKLVALILVPCVIILGFVAWRIIVRRRRKPTRSSSSLFSVENGSRSGARQDIDPLAASVEMKESSKAEYLPMDTRGGWVPQTTIRGVQISDPLMWEKSLPKTPSSSKRSPSSSHLMNSELVDSPSPLLIPTTPSVPKHPSQQPPRPPSPSIPSPPKKSNAIPQSYNDPAAAPLPKPGRSDSFYPHVSMIASKNLPRLMMVATTFSPAMADELAVEVGETVRLLEEYQDEWCLVQSVGRSNSPEGVVPRLCLQDC